MSQTVGCKEDWSHSSSLEIIGIERATLGAGARGLLCACMRAHVCLYRNLRCNADNYYHVLLTWTRYGLTVCQWL